MISQTLKHIGQGISNLNPDDVRVAAGRRVVVGLTASTGEALVAMEEFLAPSDVSRTKRVEALRCIYRTGERGAPKDVDIELCEEGTSHGRNAFPFHFSRPELTVRDVLREHEGLALPLARLFQPFRNEVSQQLVKKIAKENALFSLVTALPNVVPSIIELPWAVGEFASDTAFLTGNQIRLAFLLAAANDRPIGYADQKTEIASIVAGAFGWRAVARELAGKIPIGGGLIPKAGIAYAGTYVIGKSLERLYRFGYGFSRRERRSEYQAAYERGKQIAMILLEGLRKKGPTTA